MSRKKKFIFNTLISVIYQIIAIISGLIIPRAILSFYGSAVNGLVNSITQFLGIITFLEMGISSVIQANYYKPIADSDIIQISKIFSSSKKFFRKIGYILIAYVVALCFIFPFITEERFDLLYTGLLILCISISSFAQYYFGMSYNILLNANQTSYIAYILKIISIVINTVLCLIMIEMQCSIHFVKLAASCVFLIQPIGMKIYIEKKFKIDHNIKYDGEPIKQKWNGVAQHIAFIITTRTDTIVLTVFSTLENVSIYSVYNLVINGVNMILDTLGLGVSPLIGDMLAKKEKEKIDVFFGVYEWFIHTAVTFLFTLTGILIVPFIGVYTKGITDAEYIAPVFAVVITIAGAARMLRTPYQTVVLAAGHFKQTQTSSLIEALINIVLSVIVVFNWGLVGVAIGTFVAMAYRTVYLVIYNSKNIIFRPVKYFVKNIIIDCLSTVIMVVSTLWISKQCETYWEWIIMAVIVAVPCFVEVLIINWFFYKKELKSIKLLIKKERS